VHIPENYLSPSTCAVLGAAMLPVWGIAIKNVKKEIKKEKLPFIGICAAFSFLGMMFNIPLPGGTTGHAVGGTLIAILIGPHAACLALSVALLIQALFFGDGGIIAFGANCFNMAFLLPYGGYLVYKLIKNKFNSTKGEMIAAGIGSYVGINLAAFAAAIEFGIQPMLFTNELGQALYCPYPLSVSIPAMMIGHLTLFGLAEVIFTVALLAFLKKTSPELLSEEKNVSFKYSYAAVIAFILLSPLGLLATGTAWGEWDPKELAEMDYMGKPLGYTPQGMTTGFSLDALFPDYAISGLPEWFSYILSAIIGTAILVILFKLTALVFNRKTKLENQSVMA
jgi:cobalt/nickel transport system permease protein